MRMEAPGVRPVAEEGEEACSRILHVPSAIQDDDPQDIRARGTPQAPSDTAAPSPRSPNAFLRWTSGSRRVMLKRGGIAMRLNNDQVLSFKALRRLIGILGMVLPLVCFLGGLAFGGESLQRSISRYYYTNVRDFFVGLMLGMAFFMMTYKGHENIDTAANLATGIAGIGVGLFPCLATDPSLPVGFFQIAEKNSNVVHTSSAAVFFTIIALTCLFLFTRTGPGKPTRRKLLRNDVYRICGYAMLAALVLLAILPLVLSDEQLARTRAEFILETVLLEAFGIAWLVKGEGLLKD
jgi:hypothetical protein